MDKFKEILSEAELTEGLNKSGVLKKDFIGKDKVKIPKGTKVSIEADDFGNTLTIKATIETTMDISENPAIAMERFLK